MIKLQRFGKTIFILAIIVALGILIYFKMQKEKVNNEFDKLYDKYNGLKNVSCNNEHYKKACAGSEFKTSKDGVNYTETFTMDFNEYTYEYELNFSNPERKIVGMVYLKQGMIQGNYIDADNNVGAVYYYIDGGTNCTRISTTGITQESIQDTTYLKYCNELYTYFDYIIDKINTDLE